jgi:hypothetical protein
METTVLLIVSLGLGGYIAMAAVLSRSLCTAAELSDRDMRLCFCIGLIAGACVFAWLYQG